MRLLPNLAFFIVYITSVFSQPLFPSVNVQPAQIIEWDQTPTTFYTGQSINTTWTYQGFQPTDYAKITYPGVGGTRTLTTGSGVLVNASSYKVRLSDASNMVATNVPITVTSTTNASAYTASAQSITIIQSKLMNIVPLDGTRTLGGGQNAVCDDRNLTVTWRGLGEAQFGVATVSLSKISGSPGILGTTQTNVPVTGNTSVSIFCPRASVPSTFSQYAFQISVIETGGTAYTGTSTSFSVAAAPTPTPTPTPSNTPSKTSTPSPSPSKTPTPTPSQTPSLTSSPSQSRTPTPSGTPSSSATPSTTNTARPSIDYAAIARNAAESVDTSTPAIAGALGGIGGILVLLGAYKAYQTKLLTEKRKKKLAMTARFAQQSRSLYGIESSATEENEAATQPAIVMYTVANMPQRNTNAKSLTSIKKGFAPKPIVLK